MLVLSRREADKVLFPNLGITVEITRIQGNTVRLGIDAPKEIRVIRGELEYQPELGYNALSKGNTASQENLQLEENSASQLQKCLDAANLAIHLAQNQLRQNLSGHAEVALDQALECLDNLESAIAETQFVTEPASVKEAASRYKITKKAHTPVAAILADGQRGTVISQILESNGFEPILFEDTNSILNYLQESSQPDVVVMENFNANGSEALIDVTIQHDISKSDSEGLQINGVNSLRQHPRQFAIANPDSENSNHQLKLPTNQTYYTAWFANDNLANIVESEIGLVPV